MPENSEQKGRKIDRLKNKIGDYKDSIGQPKAMVIKRWIYDSTRRAVAISLGRFGITFLRIDGNEFSFQAFISRPLQ